MSQIFRLACQGFRKQLLQNDQNKFVMASLRPVTLKATQASLQPKLETHDERNLRLERPLSPHITIYKFELPAIGSITHRATGMALTAYAVAFGVAAIALPSPIEVYINHLAGIGAGSMIALKFTLAFPLTYHFWNGIRHLLWDTAKFLTIKDVYLTGYVMLALAISSAIALSVC